MGQPGGDASGATCGRSPGAVPVYPHFNSRGPESDKAPTRVRVEAEAEYPGDPQAPANHCRSIPVPGGTNERTLWRLGRFSAITDAPSGTRTSWSGVMCYGS